MVHSIMLQYKLLQYTPVQYKYGSACRYHSQVQCAWVQCTSLIMHTGAVHSRLAMHIGCAVQCTVAVRGTVVWGAVRSSCAQYCSAGCSAQ